MGSAWRQAPRWLFPKNAAMLPSSGHNEKKDLIVETSGSPEPKINSGVPLSQEALRKSPLEDPNILPRHRYSQEKEDVIPVFKKLTVK